jgi:hypothetical protein
LKSPSQQERTTKTNDTNVSLVPDTKSVASKITNNGNTCTRQYSTYSDHSNTNEHVNVYDTESDDHMIIRSGSTRDLREIKDIRHNAEKAHQHIHYMDQTTVNRNYQYSSLPRSHTERENIGVKFHQRERRPSGHSVHSYHGKETINRRNRPIYTINVHDDPTTKVASVEVHATPVARRPHNFGIYYHEKHSPNSSTNFDSAIDNNSPSSTSSNDSFSDPGMQRQREDVRTMHDNKEPSREDMRSRDVRNGAIDLEAIENEAADSHRYRHKRTFPETNNYVSRDHQYSTGHRSYHNDLKGHLDLDQYRTRTLDRFYKRDESQM